MAKLPPIPTPILRFTHIANLGTILQQGGLYCPNSAPKNSASYRNIYSPAVQSARSAVSISCGPMGTIHDYIPFYFGYLSPMMLQLKTGQVAGYGEGQEPLIYFVTSAQAIAQSGLGYVFSDGHGLARFTQWFDDLSDLDKVDWNMVHQRYWRDTQDDPDRQRRKQAEFLIHNFCPWSLIESIVVINSSIQQQVEAIFANFSSSDSKPIYIRRNWYYY